MDHSELLAEVASIRRKTHADLGQGTCWWLVVWAAVSLGFVLTLAVPGLHGASHWYWTVGVPVGLAGMALAEHLEPQMDRRVRRREWPYWATGGGITVLNLVGSVVLPGTWMLLWLWIVLAAGFAVLIRLDGDPRLSSAFWRLAAAFAVIAPLLGDHVEASILYGGIFGIALLAAAAVRRLRSRT